MARARNIFKSFNLWVICKSGKLETSSVLFLALDQKNMVETWLYQHHSVMSCLKIDHAWIIFVFEGLMGLLGAQLMLPKPNMAGAY
jgi:hypothetical protein